MNVVNSINYIFFLSDEYYILYHHTWINMGKAWFEAVVVGPTVVEAWGMARHMI